MIYTWRVVLRRLIRRLTFLRLRSAIGQKVRNYRRRKIELFIASAHELSVTLKRSPILNICPLWNDSHAGFEFLIPAKDSHIDFLNINLKNLAEKYGGGIKINVLVSEEIADSVQTPDILSGRVIIVTENLFHEELKELKGYISRFNENRWNWLKQQCLKTLFVSYSSNPIVILDADTLLVKPINFQPNGKNLLLMGSDLHSHFHAPYSLHIKRYLGFNPLPINFTQHCQIQEPNYVREIYTKKTVQGLSKWLESGRIPFEFSPVSEYQTYAEYVRKVYPTKTVMYSHNHHLSYLTKPPIQTDYLGLLSVDEHLKGSCQDDCDLVTMLS
jgi:hypothetical protein